MTSSYFDPAPQQQGAAPMVSQPFNPVRAQLAQAMGGGQKSMIDPMMALKLAQLSKQNQTPAPAPQQDPTDPSNVAGMTPGTPPAPTGIGALPGAFGVLGRKLQGINGPGGGPKANPQQPGPMIGSQQ